MQLHLCNEIYEIYLGIYHSCTGGKQRTTDEYLRGGKDIGVIPAALSLTVSFVSSIMIIGWPAVHLWRTVFLGWIWICSGISSLRIYLCSCTLPFENNHCKWGILRLFSLSFNCTFSYIFKTMFWNNREIYLFLPSHTFSKQSFNNREKLRFIFLDKCICFGFKLFCISDPGCSTYFT